MKGKVGRRCDGIVALQNGIGQTKEVVTGPQISEPHSLKSRVM
jgi:hypothetical protein